MLMVVLRLVKASYGSYREILDMPLDVVFIAIGYEEFLTEYENKYYELNKES